MLVDLTGVPDIAVAAAITLLASHLTDKLAALLSALEALQKAGEGEQLSLMEPQKAELMESSEGDTVEEARGEECAGGEDERLWKVGAWATIRPAITHTQRLPLVYFKNLFCQSIRQLSACSPSSAPIVCVLYARALAVRAAV